MDTRVPVACTVAASDSAGGAGLQADLRTFAFHQVHGASAVTALTVQDTRNVHEVLRMAPRFVVAQLDVVHADLHLDALKCGLLPSAPVVEAVADWLSAHETLPFVLDPVMVSRGGLRFADDATLRALGGRLLRLATIVTPNRREAEELTGLTIADVDGMREAASWLLRAGARAVLIKGGGLPGESRGADVFATPSSCEVIALPSLCTPNTHGTGCTLAAAIAARLARGDKLADAVWGAKRYVHEAIAHSVALGGGQGPVGHFWPLVGRTDAP